MDRHPTITRVAITRPCEACQGAGELVINTAPQPFGLPDPQCDEDVECEACGGDGEVTLWRDPLLVLAARRRRLGREQAWYFGPGGIPRVLAERSYRAARASAMAPVALPPSPAPRSWENAA